MHAQYDALFNPTEEHRMLRDMVADFARNEVAPQAEEQDRIGHMNVPLFRQLGELDDSVKVDEIQSRLKTVREDAVRQLKDRQDLYADGGNVALHWRDTSNQSQPNETDGEKLLRFAKSLPPRSIIRHHVAGDIGLE